MALLGGCAKESIREIGNDNSLRGPYGTWKLVSRENYATNQVFFPEPADINFYCSKPSGCDVVLTLSPGSPSGVISGHTITNEISGSFTADPALKQITILSFGGTKLGEPQWSKYVWDNIHDVGRYSVNRTSLRLYLNSKPESLSFERQ